MFLILLTLEVEQMFSSSEVGHNGGIATYTYSSCKELQGTVLERMGPGEVTLWRPSAFWVGPMMANLND